MSISELPIKVASSLWPYCLSNVLFFVFGLVMALTVREESTDLVSGMIRGCYKPDYEFLLRGREALDSCFTTTLILVRVALEGDDLTLGLGLTIGLFVIVIAGCFLLVLDWKCLLFYLSCCAIVVFSSSMTLSLIVSEPWLGPCLCPRAIF